MKLFKKGLRSDVYDLEDGRLLKLYNGWVTEEDVAREFNATRAAFDAGISCARVHEVIEKNYRHGIIFDLIKAENLRQHITSRPWNVRRYGLQMARLHAQVHAVQLSGLRSQKAQMESAIQESYSILKPYWNKIMEYTEPLSDSPSCLCHGDFSVENILLPPAGPVLVDWADACTGNPAGDVARAWILVHTPYSDLGTPIWAKGISGAVKRRLFQYYLNEYVTITGISKAQCTAWQVPMAAARLRECVPNEKEWLLRIIRNGAHPPH